MKKRSLALKKFKTYQEFGEKVYKFVKMLEKNLKKIKEKNNLIIGFGAPAKATTALNFYITTKLILL